MKSSQKSANAYDFDHTIYRGDASLDFIKYCLLRYPVNIFLLPAYAWILFLYVLGRKDRKQVKEVAFSFLRNHKNLDEDVRRFWDKNENKVEDWYLNQKQSSDVIISASPDFLLQPIAKKLNVKHLIATRMDKNTGKITGENCRGEEKVSRLKKEFDNPRFMNVYSDTLSDLPILKLAKKPYIVQRGIIMTLDNYQNDKDNKGSRKALLRELFLYGVIGGSTAALDVLLFHVLVAIDISLLIANFISVSVAVGSSFLLNAKYNFKKTDNLGKRAIKFFSIGYFGWFVQSVILLIGVDAMGYGETYVKIFAVFVAAAIQYLLNKFLTFRD